MDRMSTKARQGTFQVTIDIQSMSLAQPTMLQVFGQGGWDSVQVSPCFRLMLRG